MKKLLSALLLLLPLACSPPATAESITLEFMWGLGKSSPQQTGSDSKYCKNRSWGRLKGLGLRYAQDNVEAHVSRYSHDADTDNCNRSNWAIGLGLVVSSLEEENEDIYGNIGVGGAYLISDTWRSHGPLTLYGRADIGFAVENGGDDQLNVQLGYLQYGGWFEPNHGERFLTLGLNYTELNILDGEPVSAVDGLKAVSDPSGPSITPPEGQGGGNTPVGDTVISNVDNSTTITNDNDTTIINTTEVTTTTTTTVTKETDVDINKVVNPIQKVGKPKAKKPKKKHPAKKPKTKPYKKHKHRGQD